MAIYLDLSQVGRPTALRAWLVYHGLEIKTLAERVGIAPWTMSKIVAGERAPRDILARLVAAGVPPELLPSPRPGPGRPRKVGEVDDPPAGDGPDEDPAT